MAAFQAAYGLEAKNYDKPFPRFCNAERNAILYSALPLLVNQIELKEKT